MGKEMREQINRFKDFILKENINPLNNLFYHITPDVNLNNIRKRGLLKTKLLCVVDTAKIVVVANQMEFAQIVMKNFTLWIINILKWTKKLILAMSLLKR
jgi:hypothetical protein